MTVYVLIMLNEVSSKF